MKKILLLSIACLFASISFAQVLVSSSFLISHSKDAVANRYGIPPAFIRNGVDLYKVTYNTVNVHGEPDVASGLIVVPDDVAIFPLLCYQHGTVGSRTQVPSVLGNGGWPSGDDLAVVFGSFGYVSTAADFIGLGVSPGFHPYVHAASEASAAVDLLFAAREFMDAQPAQLNDQLFISGYSQGGHAAMAAYRSIQQDYADEFTVTAAAPMSGPYSISGAMKDVILQDDPYLFAGYLPNTALSYDLAYGLFDDFEEYFKQPYAGWIENYYNEGIDLWTLNAQLLTQLVIDAGGYFPKFMLQDSIIDAAINEENHPLNVALRDNDVYDWTPMSPTRIYYCTADDQVTYRNSIIADSVMQMNGAPDLQAIDADPTADHGGCVNPAVTATLFFFGDYRQIGEITGTNQLAIDNKALTLSPNPVVDQLDIHWSGGEATLGLYNSTGQLVLEQAINKEHQQLSVKHLPKGMYFVTVSDGQVRATDKLLVK